MFPRPPSISSRYSRPSGQFEGRDCREAYKARHAKLVDAAPWTSGYLIVSLQEPQCIDHSRLTYLHCLKYEIPRPPYTDNGQFPRNPEMKTWSQGPGAPSQGTMTRALSRIKSSSYKLRGYPDGSRGLYFPLQNSSLGSCRGSDTKKSGMVPSL